MYFKLYIYNAAVLEPIGNIVHIPYIVLYMSMTRVYSNHFVESNVIFYKVLLQFFFFYQNQNNYQKCIYLFNMCIRASHSYYYIIVVLWDETCVVLCKQES